MSMLMEVVWCIRYLAKQGLALRGDIDEQGGNIIQLTNLKDTIKLENIQRWATKHVFNDFTIDYK